MITGCLLVLFFSFAPALPAADRITLPVDEGQRAVLPGHVSPRIAAAADQGPVDPSMQLPYVTLALKPSAAQKEDLTRLLAQQQDPSSPNYHAWLTPEQYGDRFGVSRPDIDKIVAWLGRHGLTVQSVARGRNAISFNGSVSQVASAFGIQIHRYVVQGEAHYANTADPTIPVAFQGVVLGIHGFNDFRWKPMLRRSVQPRDNSSSGHYLAPDDVATIYDINPLYTAGIDGAGQTLAVAGQTQINISDIQTFRSYFNLPANNPTLVEVPNYPTGISQGDLAEADLDLELSGAVARNAAIIFYYSSDVIESLRYAIDEDKAPVISISYGDCELDEGSSEAEMQASWAMQANNQGQTIFAASGDSGAADCFGDGDGPAIDNALSVDLPAALPEVTGVGGTEFNEGSGTYWRTTDIANHESALSYIPETAWNDSVLDGEPSASGGGVSVFFTKPPWQTATNVPADGHRDVPDVSLSGSDNHDAYEVYTGGSWQAFGGTSCGPPQFSGIAALLAQYLQKNNFQTTANLGNINQTLYTLASVAGVFHDVTTGNNIVVPCQQPCSGTAIGYSAGPGYDQVTGLGTPDVYNLISAWHSGIISSKDSVTVALTASPTSVTFTDTAALTATVTGAGGVTPTGTVTFFLSNGEDLLGTATLNGSGVASLTINGLQLAVGPNTITAQYGGDNTYFGGEASASVTVTSATNGSPSVTSLLNSGSFSPTYAPGGILSIFGAQLAPATSGAPGVPLPTLLAGSTVTIDGIPAPLYYVSPAQLNVQIPFGVPTGTAVSITISNNGLKAFDNFTIAAAAPAIFAMNSEGTGQGAILDNSTYQVLDASHPATPGSTYVQIYCMGLGAVSNQPADGAAAPSNPLAKTIATPQVTIGGIQTPAVFSGLAPGFVGLYQVDALVPATVTAGNNVPVVVSIGGVTSNTVTIVVALP